MGGLRGAGFERENTEWSSALEYASGKTDNDKRQGNLIDTQKIRIKYYVDRVGERIISPILNSRSRPERGAGPNAE